MKRFGIFVYKEFLHVMRDRKTLLILFGMPVIQILIFGFVLTNEVKNAKIVILDQATDQASRQVIDKISASRYFDIERSIRTKGQIEDAFKEGKIKIALIIPQGFQADLMHGKSAKIQILSDASDPNTATTLNSYITAIIRDFQVNGSNEIKMPYRIEPEIRMMYNPQMKGAYNYVPGVMAMVLMLVSVMMTAISIVKEKETGTMEILLVSPFKPAMVIVSKAIPYLFLSLLNITSILLLSYYVLDVPNNGSLALLYFESILFIITCLTIGILISIQTATQQAAMLISLMGMLLPTLLFSGFMFPIENMPLPIQIVSNIIPAKWFFIIVKSIMIKGVGFAAIWKETLYLCLITLILFLISIKKFKIRLQ
jgi:ABC-2 type transport system permease protein